MLDRLRLRRQGPAAVAFLCLLAVMGPFATPGRAASAVPEDGRTTYFPPVVAVGGGYAGWKLHVPEQGLFTVAWKGTTLGGIFLWLVRTDRRGGGGVAGGSRSPKVIALGDVQVPYGPPLSGEGGVRLEPGDYYVFAAAPGGVTNQTFVLRGPAGASVKGLLLGPAYGFTPADFVTPDGEARPVTIQVRHALFAAFVACADTVPSISGPEPASGWNRGVSYGQPGLWTFRLEPRPGHEPDPCPGGLIAVDLPLPGPIPSP